MTIFQSLIFLTLFFPVVAIACVSLVEARRDPKRERPFMSDATWGSGEIGSGGGSGGDGG